MDLTNIVLHLPWPPTVNDYYAHTKQGVFISKKGRIYREKVEEEVREQSINKLDILDTRLCVKIVLHPPDDRGRDVDNYNKSLLDALTHAKVWEDDKLIDQMFVFRGRNVSRGKVIVMITDAGIIIPVNNEHIIKEL